MKKTTFVAKVLDFIQGGEEGQIKKFQKENLKALTQQVKIREGDLEECDELILEKRLELSEAAINVDVERVKTVGDRKSYIEVYNANLLELTGAVDDIEDRKHTLLTEINKFKTLIKLIEDE